MRPFHRLRGVEKRRKSVNVEIEEEDKQRKASYQLWPMAPLVSTQRNQTTTDVTTQPKTQQTTRDKQMNKQTSSGQWLHWLQPNATRQPPV